MRLWFKLAEISGEMEGENTMEKRLGVFRAHSRFVFDFVTKAIQLAQSRRGDRFKKSARRTCNGNT